MTATVHPLPSAFPGLSGAALSPQPAPAPSGSVSLEGATRLHEPRSIARPYNAADVERATGTIKLLTDLYLSGLTKRMETVIENLEHSAEVRASWASFKDVLADAVADLTGNMAKAVEGE